MTDGCTRRLYRQVVDAEPEVLFRIRRVTADQLRSWGQECLVGTVVLAVTELLGNVCKHAGSRRCVLTLEETAAGVRLTVSDASTQVPVVREPDWSAESGRGMYLVTSAANSFGWARRSAGKDVWVEFGADAADAVA